MSDTTAVPGAPATAPADPTSPVASPQAPQAPIEDEGLFVASQWRLMWWKFRKHKAAIVATVFIVIMYMLGLFCELLSPYEPNVRRPDHVFVPPMRIRFLDQGQFHLRPFVYGLQLTRDPNTLRRTYAVDRDVRHHLRLFVRGEEYKFWGTWRSDLHLVGVDQGGVMFLLGTDRMGRDMLSRVLYGTRVSLSIGLVGVALSLVIGIMLGGISGYFGGVADNVIQRGIEVVRSFPDIPLWMALSAALPPQWPALRVYFGITIILSLVGWTGVARVVRGKLLSLREEDFVTAARLLGTREHRIIQRHLLPSFMSHIIVTVTIRIPGVILAETALSFLGLGLRAPVTSWGVLLQEAQNMRTVALNPWLIMPVLFVIVAVIAFNFIGDGLRDAADPYA